MDQYDKGATLGEGTFGIVFKATHKEVVLNTYIYNLSVKMYGLTLHLVNRLGKWLPSKKSGLERPRKVSM